MVAAIDDLMGGRGWNGTEFPGLAERLRQRADVVLMLALVHHLAIGAAVPMAAVAEFAAACTRRHLVIEWIAADDPQLLELCAQRRRNPADFSLERQRATFAKAGCEIEAEVDLQPAMRTLALLRRVGPA